MKVRIVRIPPGEAPEAIRQAWVGLVLPVLSPQGGPGTYRVSGVLSGPKGRVGRLSAALLGRFRSEVGYPVDARTAIDLLAVQAPEAAEWWRQNVPRLLTPGAHLVFAAEACEEIREPSTPPTQVYMHLRQMALELSPASIGVVAGSDEPYGILMDMGQPNGIATLASFVTGDTSLYTSTGGGILGGIGHESVRSAAKRWVSSARSYTQNMEATMSYPLPAPGRVRFYVLTPQGILTAEADSQELGAKKSDLSPLFYAGQDVLTEVRSVSEKKSQS